MAQHNRHKSRFGARLSQWQAALLLCVFLAVRGLVPAGFMPAPLAAGTPYGFCHGDGRSALLLNALAQWEHAHHGHGGGHSHDALTAQTFADNHCSFSAGVGLAAAPSVHLPFFSAGATAPTPTPAAPAARVNPYALPPSRAPPRFPSA